MADKAEATKTEQPAVTEVAAIKPQDKKMDLVIGELKSAIAGKVDNPSKDVQEPTTSTKDVPEPKIEKVVESKPTPIEVKTTSTVETVKPKQEVNETKPTPVAAVAPSKITTPEVKKDIVLSTKEDSKTTLPAVETSFMKKLETEISPRLSSKTEDTSMPDLPVRMRRRPKPGSSNWTRPHTSLYESNYATSSRIYSNAMSRIEAKSEVPISLDDYRSTDVDSYAESLVGSAVNRAATRYATRARASTSRARELSLSRPATWMVTNDDRSVIEERLRLKGIELERYSVAPSTVSVASQPVLPYLGSRRGSSQAPSVIGGDDADTLVDHDYEAR